jgi:Fe-S cluster biogenesis protein NfuA
MFIQTEALPDGAAMRFMPGRAVLAAGERDFADAAAAAASPLAARLFEIEGVTGVRLEAEALVVAKAPAADWALIKPPILGVIMEHFVAGRPILAEGAAAPGEGVEEDDEATAEIRELIETRIRPAAAQSGGDVIFRGFSDGVVLLELQGAGHALKDRIAAMLQHYVPEVREVRDVVDAQDKPGLDTPEGIEVRRVLDERINPAVAGHGGHVALVDVQDDRVYIRLEGGCQGCGMADVTLKQGIEVEIKRAVAGITAVLDVTDHAGGTNPYYQPGKGGVSPY